MSHQDLRPPKQRARAEHSASSGGASKWLLMVLAIAAVAYGAWYAREYWAAKDRNKANANAPALTVPSPDGVQEPEAAPSFVPLQPLTPAPEPVLPPSSIGEGESEAEAEALHPIALSDAPVASSNTASIDQRVLQWLGQPALKFLATPGLAHHIVATIDNLPRSHAAPRLWPLSPVGGKMMVQENAGAQSMHIAPGNSVRYDAIVDFVTSIDPAQAGQWYREIYPVLQQTYEDLGFPGQHFNDRLIEVIDHLLQTPQVQEPIALRLVQVQGQIAPQQPWLRYEYVDAQMQSLSAGQKILLRIGHAHRQRIAAYLLALRMQIASQS